MNPPPVAGPDPVARVWTALRQHLESRFRQSCEELRHYPRPIARCDDQLPKLIEQRDHSRAELERMTASSGTAVAVGTDAVQRFLATATPTDDDTETLLRSRLKAAASHE